MQRRFRAAGKEMMASTARDPRLDAAAPEEGELVDRGVGRGHAPWPGAAPALRMSRGGRTGGH